MAKVLRARSGVHFIDGAAEGCHKQIARAVKSQPNGPSNPEAKVPGTPSGVIL